MFDLTPQQMAISQAAKHAWTAFWHSCMSTAGGQSLLPYDAELVADALGARKPAELPRLSDWAQQLKSDERNSGITLSDVLMGLDDYFNTFKKLRRVNAPAYEYFRRIGVPLCFSNNAMLKKTIDDAALGVLTVNPVNMPSYLGLYIVKTQEEAKQDWIKDRPAFMDFQLYVKRRRNLATIAPPGYTIYEYDAFHLDRDHKLTKAERRKYDGLATSWGYTYFIGVSPAGLVRALPMKREKSQYLPNGGTIRHNVFDIPPGLYGHGRPGKPLTPDQVASVSFALVRGFAAATLGGVQVSIRRGNQVARFGVPIAYIKSFFRDRDPTGNRRNPLMHYVGGHMRVMADGREIWVGEHLRGVRKFTWRGHTIIVSAPGIHHAAPEGMAAEVLTDDDLMPVNEKTTIPIWVGAGHIQKEIEKVRKVPMRKGKPTKEFSFHYLGNDVETLGGSNE